MELGRPVETKKIKLSEAPRGFAIAGRDRVLKGNLFFFGEVFKGHMPYAIPEEKQMAGHFGLAYRLKRAGYKSTFMREDGTVWRVDIAEFEILTQCEVEANE